jgi:hypothetical protein
MKKLGWIALLIGFAVLIISATNDKVLTDQQVYKMINIEGVNESNYLILHKEKVENSLVVFYGDYKINNSLEVGFMKKKLFGWEETLDRGGGGFGIPNHNISSIFLPKMDKKSPFPLLMGLTNGEIAKVEVEYSYRGDFKKETAKTIQGKDRYFWVAFVEEPRETTIYKIMGYSSNGELVETIEEESVHLPKD